MRSISRPASKILSELLAPRSLRTHSTLLSLSPKAPSALRQTVSPRSSFAPFQRYSSSLSVPGAEPRAAEEKRDEPSYELSFTCKPCLYRSTHRVTKHGYHHGTVLITCPSCKNRHVISDHLRVFIDQKSTLEDILRRQAAKGQDFAKLLKKGSLGIRPGNLVGNEGEEDLEFWEDGTETVHTPIEEKRKSQPPSKEGSVGTE
ncbi:DNL-type zinc finger protein [Cladophialophora carrionii]|uniref:DNL-type zinc finger protein n=1 Tax=Cladophialophora carrionii TaxID=86049 RepID=A0A1C1CD56_9EURO|nr:DNL-type zinc finger protein [Cladophialophora carrionii]